MGDDIRHLLKSAARAPVLRLFLDYDGTIADFAPTPDTILPDAELLCLIKKLMDTEGVMPAVISGRRLSHIQALLPLPGLLMAGTYGVEMSLPDGEIRHALHYSDIRPVIEQVLNNWMELLSKHDGFYLEDKGWSVALHGKNADTKEAAEVFPAARAILKRFIQEDQFRILDGDKFLEFVPTQAGKPEAVTWIMNTLTPSGAMIIYFGDDDKDEEAFAVVKAAGGSAIRVATTPGHSCADFMVANPRDVRTWLCELIELRQNPNTTY